MKPSFILFVVVVILGFFGGFYYHEALNEKITYERNQCYDVMNEHLAVTNPEYMHDMILNESEAISYEKSRQNN